MDDIRTDQLIDSEDAKNSENKLSIVFAYDEIWLSTNKKFVPWVKGKSIKESLGI